MSEKRLIELETKLAFQETMVEELNEIVTRQQQQLDIMRAAIEQLNDRLQSASEQTIMEPSQEQPPPHY